MKRDRKESKRNERKQLNYGKTKAQKRKSKWDEKVNAKNDKCKILYNTVITSKVTY